MNFAFKIKPKMLENFLECEAEIKREKKEANAGDERLESKAKNCKNDAQNQSISN